MPEPEPTIRVPAVVLAIGCAVLQVLAYRHSWLTDVTHPYQCLAIPQGDCRAIMASGYVDVLHSFGAGWNLEEMVAVLVPLWLWIAVVAAVRAPAIRPRALLAYGVALALAVALGATQLRHNPGPTMVEDPQPIRP